MKTLLQIDESEPRRPPTGWALWALGFRPLYLLAAAYAALAIVVWALQYAGVLPGLRSSMWHAHELLFGFTTAIIVGFLFTAGRNWSGQPTPTGPALMAIAALWVAGRALAYLPTGVWTLVVNVAFPAVSAIALFRALQAGGNRRNYFFSAVLLGLAVAQGVLLATLMGWLAISPGWAVQIGLDAVLFVMAVMGGRVIPMFSNNGAPGTDAQRDPRLEKLALGTILALLALDVAGARGPLLGTVALVAALAHGARLALWHPWRTRRVPIVWVLHLAYAWIPVHLLLRGAASIGEVAPSLATHALTAGAIGGLTIGMMTRTARGHLGRPLRAERAEVAMYALVALGALVRVGVPLIAPARMATAVTVSGLLWAAGFALYALRYGPWLCRPRADGREG